MNTSKPFSTISYNSIPFLTKVLKRKIEQGEIGFYCFVYHFAEDNDLDADKMKKDHLHLYIEPEKRIDTIALARDFHEFVSDNEKPLGIVKCKSSKFQEWYLYCCHDSRYLGAKGLDRKYHYTENDFIASDYVYFSESIKTMDLSKYTCLDRFLNAVRGGLSFSKCVENGLVPVQLIGQYQRVYDLMDNIDKKQEREYSKQAYQEVEDRRIQEFKRRNNMIDTTKAYTSKDLLALSNSFIVDSDTSFHGADGGSKGGV